MKVVYNGVNTDKYKHSKEMREIYRAKYDLEDNFVLLFIGRICEQKRGTYSFRVV